MLEGIADGTSVRIWLAKQLNCAPMRLSKKFNKASGLLGMNMFKFNRHRMAALSPEERDERRLQLDNMRCIFEQSLSVLAVNPVMIKQELHQRSVSKARRRSVKVRHTIKEELVVAQLAQLNIGDEVKEQELDLALLMTPSSMCMCDCQMEFMSEEDIRVLEDAVGEMASPTPFDDGFWAITQDFEAMHFNQWEEYML
ncbi:Aste57867_5325 [Aphanomyces stellatus]|uniref:Aste57867_5325 protein n=1 Tax=Aphanomyces stellatus TaxID=120398 RepID=A0A485KFB8_9STRA|nr:hypothetical protein As57867_005312 [Aphanomyces stellatus]VFT82390.1 Aste57867_5325 [Aphanomyces stellatus]